MSLMDKIRKSFGSDNYDENSYDDYYDEFENSDGSDTVRDSNQSSQQQYEAPVQTQTIPSYQQFQQPSAGISLSAAALEMKVVKPEHFDSASQIADHLLNNRTVVLNLENTNKETARRLIDFLSGVAYSIDGSLKKIASNAYVITPNNVDVGEARLASTDEDEVKEEAPAESNEEFGSF